MSLTFYAILIVAHIFNREPLEKTKFTELPIGAIQPQGWLLEQLNRQASGLTGHLDEVYPEVMGDSNAWLGGDGDAWERGPYWIDGLLPLAYILNDNGLKAKALKWVEAILSSQQEDGYFGPAEDHPFVYGLQRGSSHDWWPKMVALKIMKQYYMATGDERVIGFFTKYFRYQEKHLPSQPLNHWTDWEQLSGADFTYSTEAPRKCIDYIFHLKGSAPAEVVSSKVVTSGTADLSDHFPIAVTIRKTR